jgi:hypothetical protein
MCREVEATLESLHVSILVDGLPGNSQPITSFTHQLCEWTVLNIQSNVASAVISCKHTGEIQREKWPAELSQFRA